MSDLEKRRLETIDDLKRFAGLEVDGTLDEVMGVWIMQWRENNKFRKAVCSDMAQTGGIPMATKKKRRKIIVRDYNE